MADEKSFDRPVYVISVAAELAAMHPQTLRMYERRGLLMPRRLPSNRRLYSEHDLARLRRIQELTEMGLNLAGVERVLQLEEDLAAMQADMQRLQEALQQAALRLHEEIRRVEREHRHELVPVQRAAVVRLRRERGREER
jgi:MerR family transcriptional regulator, heat shock protein HspR